jgi:hypothetical protein
MMADPTKWDPLPDAQKEALYRGAYGASVPENVLRPKTNGRILIFDMAKKTLVDQATGQGVASKGPNDTILTSDRDQRPLADHGTYLDRPVIGPDGNPDPTKVYVMKDGNITIQTIPGGGSLGPKPGTTKPTTIPTSEFNKLQGLRVKTASKPGTLQSLTGGMLGSPNEPKPADVEAFRSYAKAEVAKLGIPPTVQSAFNEVIDDPHAENFSSAQVASGFSKLSEAERAILQKVLTEVRGK